MTLASLARPVTRPVTRTIAWAWPWARQVRGADLLLALALLALLAFWTVGLGQAPLLDVDEGAFAEASREMLASGDWGHTTLNGSDRFDKPILVYWLQAASLALLGPSEVAVRLPSALCGWAWGLALAAFAAPRWGRPCAACAAALLATSLGPMLIGRAATADALLNLLLTLTLLDLWRWLEAEPQAAPATAALRRAFAWTGLGLLTKGPVALVVPLGALLLWAVAGGRTAGSRLRPGLRDRWAWALLIGLSVPWYLYALARHGGAFVEGFFLHHNVERFAATLEGHGGSPAYHLVVLPLLLLPWTPLLLPPLRALGRTWRDERQRFLLAWAAFVLLFFSLAATKLPHYALYGLTPLVLLAAQTLSRGALPGSLLLAVGTLAMLSVLGGAASVPAAQAWLALAEPGATADYWQLRVQAGLQGPGPASGLAVFALLAQAALLLAGWRWAFSRPAVLLATAGVASAWWVLAVLPWWAGVLQSPVQALALEARARGLTLVQWQVHQPSAGFYRAAPVPRRAPQAGEAALLRSDRLDTAATQLGLPLQVLQRAPGFVLVRAGDAPARP